MEVQRGINTVRGLDSTRIDLMISLRLGHVFSKMGQNTTSEPMFEQRSLAFFSSALAILQANDTSCTKNYLFEEIAVKSEEKDKLLDEAVTCVCAKLVKENMLEHCIDTIGNLENPFAFYFLSHCNKKLNEDSGKVDYLKRAEKWAKKLKNWSQTNQRDNDHPLISLMNYSPESTPIIGMLIDDSVIDSNNEVISIDAFINKVTPQKCDYMKLLHAPIQCPDVDSASEGMEPATSTNHMKNLYEEFCNTLSEESATHELGNEIKSVHEPTTSSCETQIASRPNECPVVGCNRIIKHFPRNSKRHIKEHHGERLRNGKWALKRYQCADCREKKIKKIAKRPSNLTQHYKSFHPGKELATVPHFIYLESPLQFKNEYEAEEAMETEYEETME